ncbi:MAG: c-type cytochrome, partial [Woeseiaceae bacterium]
MYRLISIIIVGALTTGCSRQPDIATSNVVNGAADPELSSSTDRRGEDELSALSGEAAYYMACASCHETGSNGAPLTGDSAAWANRSQLWQAVLAEHANKGYMDMPAKGGNVELSDWVVIRATEFMMSS